ncbi:GntR family transcriptional regulator [Desulfonispora thiosulfatigenes DSM 11270]|uniref:GntR family transcriptional regulator n=1 Tax=Desulfonispora thiosulfatigenes DSM 11270 TaxID=656914 RepID=A0A1W1VK32_DESTI|nr:GntR family transcriptional regulator [Desulfonispora thiosulfatigenes]SMB93735.1 GntR family transcriptional regulator [Desulfonispora thiosulfatigenes DSM 11270]
MGFTKHLPLHIQIKIKLEEEILNEVYDEKIPGELDLMERFSVSRSTIRQAIAALVEEGILEKRHGKGTFISLKPVEEWLGSFSTYENIIDDMGMKPYIKFLSMEMTSTPQNVAKTLEEEVFYKVKRIRYADENPVSIEENYYPLELGKKLAKFNWDNVASYSLLDSLGVKLWDAKQIITCRMPVKEECKLLNIDETIPVLFIERLNFDREGNIVEYEHSVYRSDHYAFIVKLGRNEN